MIVRYALAAAGPLAVTLVLAACGQPAGDKAAPVAAPGKPVPAGAPVAAAAAPAADPEPDFHADSESGYVWHTAHENESAQYGVEGSDDRALRLDCEPSGMISIMAGTAAEPAGSTVPVILQGRGGRRTLPGMVIELGDGNNFSVEVPMTDDAVTTLMAGGDLTVGSAGDEWTVPGKGAAKALAPVLETCRTR